MPGDDVLPDAQFRPIRAITIDAPPATAWPWFAQVLDNFAHPSLREIDPKLQQLEVGQWVSMSPTPSERTAWTVDSFVQNEWLLWRKPDSTCSWVLRNLGGGRTRLVNRVHVRYDCSSPASAAFGLVLMELGDFAMMRRMLQGIKQGAESSSGRR
jgi:hypothetical protein